VLAAVAGAFMVLSLTLASFGCGAVKPVARTINDVATVLCELYATENPNVISDGLDPSQWCQVKRNIDPFIDEVLAAKHAVGQRLANQARE